MTSIGIAGFFAGIVVGSCLPMVLAAPQTDEDPWLKLAKASYKLRRDQIDAVRGVLVARDRRIQGILLRNVTLLPKADQNRIEKLRRLADDRIEVILDEAQRAQYRKDKDQPFTSGGNK